MEKLDRNRVAIEPHPKDRRGEEESGGEVEPTPIFLMYYM